MKYLLIAVFAAILIWYSADAVMKWWDYTSLTATAPAEAVQFTVHEKSSDKFFMKGHYQFEVEGAVYQGETIIKSLLIRNQTVAAETIGEFETKPWSVWYNPKDPSHSALEKTYPFKECLYTTILWALFFYSVWLITRSARLNY